MMCEQLWWSGRYFHDFSVKLVGEVILLAHACCLIGENLKILNISKKKKKNIQG